MIFHYKALFPTQQLLKRLTSHMQISQTCTFFKDTHFLGCLIKLLLTFSSMLRSSEESKRENDGRGGVWRTGKILIEEEFLLAYSWAAPQSKDFEVEIGMEIFLPEGFQRIILEGFLGHGWTPVGISFHLTQLHMFKKHMLSMPVGFSVKLIKELILSSTKCSTSVLKNAS